MSKKRFCNTNFLYNLVSSLLTIEEPSNCLDWAERNLVLLRHEAQPGPYSYRRTPYLKRISEALMNPRYKTVVVWLPSQSGKTMLVLIFMAHRLVTDPCPIILAVPSRKLAKKMSADRFMNFARGCEQLYPLVKSGENSDTYDKFVNGAPLHFTWTSSAVEVASTAAGVVIIDELDRVGNIKNEGDPGELLETRTTTYYNRKIVKTSTGTVKGHSPIESDFFTGTQEIYHLLCPACDKMFEPKFEIIKWQKDCKSETEVEESARLHCPNCNHPMTDNDIKTAHSCYIGKGQTAGIGKEITGELEPNSTASFRVSGVFSPWLQLGKMCSRFWKANKSLNNRLNKVMAIINTVFNETFELEGEVIEWQEIKHKCRKRYNKESVPDGVTTLVLSGDVHDNDIHYTVLGFTDAAEPYAIDWGIIIGDTRESETWNKFESIYQRQYDGYQIALLACDAGYRTNYVQDFCRRNPKKYIPVLGRQQSKPIIFSNIDVDGKKRKVLTKKKNLKQAFIWDDYYKNMLYDRLLSSELDTLYLPQDVDDEFIQQLTGEKRILWEGQITWEKTRKNHFLDTTKICLCLGEILQVGRKKKKEKE